MEVRYTELAVEMDAANRIFTTLPVEALSGDGAVLGFAAFELCDFNIVRILC